jgi:hypothetical protein
MRSASLGAFVDMDDRSASDKRQETDKLVIAEAAGV